MSFKFEQIHVSEHNIDIKTIVQTIENNKCTHRYPNKLLQTVETEELLFLVFQFRRPKVNLLVIVTSVH